MPPARLRGRPPLSVPPLRRPTPLCVKRRLITPSNRVVIADESAGKEESVDRCRLAFPEEHMQWH